MAKFKLRAECEADVFIAIRQLGPAFTGPITIASIGKLGFDTTLTFEAALTLPQVRKILEGIVDGHVMAETVALEADYTGNRV